MKKVAVYQQGAVVTAGILPVVGAAMQAEWALLLLFALWPSIWLLLIWRQANGKMPPYIPNDYPNYLLILSGLLLAYAAWLNVAGGWLLGGMLATLAAWDLDAFQRRLGHVNHIEQEAQMVQHHLRYLLIALTLGLLLGTAALLFQFELRFGWGLLLVLLIMLSFRQVLGSLKRS